MVMSTFTFPIVPPAPFVVGPRPILAVSYSDRPARRNSSHGAPRMEKGPA
jgi:hypothetical protein